jgi:hypothetical protein
MVADDQIVTLEMLQAVAALAPVEPVKGTSMPMGANGHNGHGSPYPFLFVDRWLNARGIEFKVKQLPNATAYLIRSPFNENHGANGEVAIVQRCDGMLTFEDKHASGQGLRWSDVRDAIGKPDPEHYDRPPAAHQPARHTSPRVTHDAPRPLPTIEPGTKVRALDRDNFGEVVTDNGATCIVHFVSPEGTTADVELPKNKLVDTTGRMLATPADPGPPVVRLVDLVEKHPKLRPPIIDGILRRGETANVVAAPKQGKSWLAGGLMLTAVTGGV